ncbi:MAG TPA: AMP-binding protein, partial [Acidimicrobiales bacterium]|nr:AMP-binding protein [Acidimicrobiales bacterium]
ALKSGKTYRTWAEFDERADGVARTLLDAGLGHQDKVAQYLYNCNEYIESLFGCFKASLVPVNTNYRYTDKELAYLWENADAAAIVFHGAFTSRVDALRGELPLVKCFLHVDDGTEPCPDWAIPYETAAAAAAPGSGVERPVRGPSGLSGDDLYMLYTGGTTGMPKGVMWRQDDLFTVINDGSPAKLPVEQGRDALAAAIEGFGAMGVSLMPACPLMHGTGAFTTVAALNAGGCVVTLPDRQFSAARLLEVIAEEKVNIVTIVGDAFARPILAELDAHPGHYDISSLFAMISSGVMWSEETKQGLLRHHPAMLLIDVFSSSEAIGLGQSVSTAGSEAHTATFTPGRGAIVIDDDGRRLENGSPETGRLTIAGRVPVGYYKDPEKSARTFPVIDGVRYSVPGDYATIDAEGTVHVLGRGSLVINTGGEKVFPEEVEEAIKTHPAVADAAAVGLPDERFGETVCALVELKPDLSGPAPTAEEIVEHVREQIAAFKAPRRIVFVPSVGRSPAGKLDYGTLKETAVAEAAAS